jgi:transketolase
MSTTKGKGISYMEDQAGWHGKAPNDEQYEQGMAELAAARKQIEEA